MSEGNGNGDGVIRVERRGLRKFALGDMPPKEIDVTHAYSEWCRVDRQYRGADGRVPPEKAAELNEMAIKFARDMLLDAGSQADVNLTEALTFLRLLTEEAEKLSGFFAPPTSGGPSSPGRTAVTFSE